MKEIGGYLQLDQFIEKPYHKGMIELNTARNALIYLIKANRIEKVYIPYFLCNSISNALKRYSINYEYYNVDKKFHPLFNKELKQNEYIYVVNYFGQISDNIIIALKEKYRNIIIDNVQAFFQKPKEGIHTIYSCRKFLGVPDGAYLYTDTTLKEEFEMDKSANRMTHILGRFEGNASDYYESFKKNDEFFKIQPIKKMSRLTRNILGAIDYKTIIKKRNSNFTFLNDKLNSSNILNIKHVNGAFTYAYYIRNGIEIRKKLAQKKIYIPTLWPNVLKDSPKDSIEYDYTANILPLPCDQRYENEDMNTIVKEIYKCIN